MTGPDPSTFWPRAMESIGRALPEGLGAVAAVLQTHADELGFVQDIDDERISWSTEDGEHALSFHWVPDPTSLTRVLEALLESRSRGGLHALLVHQRTEGSWDVFAVSPRRGLQHAHRFPAVQTPSDHGLVRREDVYRLFAALGELA